MARRLLREIAMRDGSNKGRANSFAECCINILQTGCRYSKQVEHHIKRLLRTQEEKVCCDILETMKRPHREVYRPKNLGPAPPQKRRFQSPDSRVHDHNLPLYYTDKNPHEYNRFRPEQQQHYHQHHRKRKRRRYQPEPRQMGRMESERGRTHARTEPSQSQPKRSGNGS